MTRVQPGEVKLLPAVSDALGSYCLNIDQSEWTKLANHSSVMLHFGTALMSADIESLNSDMPGDKLLLSGDIVRQLKLPDPEKLAITICGDQVVFGPLIGVFVSEWEIENLNRGTCKNKNFYRYIRACNELNAVCCFFSLGDVFWEQRLMKGWVLQDIEGTGGKWVARIFPIPTAIYDRCFGSRGKIDGHELRSRLSSIRGVTVFNSLPKLQKWETYQLLNQDPELRACLPDYWQYSGPVELSKILDIYERVYLKPDGLSKGSGVFKLTKFPKGFILEHRGDGANEAFLLENLSGLDKFLEPYNQKGGGYIIQQEIPLARYKKNKFDMRVLCQKDIEGKWIIGGIAVRVAAPNSIITSPRSGGAVISWPEALEAAFGQRVDSQDGIDSKVSRVSFRICKVIEERFGCCGEMGLDLAIDNRGDVWIIEVNAKPLKVSLKRLNDEKLFQQVNANPLRFAYYLALKNVRG